jgi:hypothetical protein
MEKMNSLFLSWSKQNLSILGKVLIIKALIIPIFPYKFKTLTLYLFFVFSGITHELTIKVKIGIIKALMISTLPNIERFCFEHDKHKLFIFSICIRLIFKMNRCEKTYSF